MKTIYKAIFILLLACFTSACEYDNYDEPAAVIEGSFTYQDQKVGIKHNLDVLRLFEEGWQNSTPINISVHQQGTFRTELFHGDYKLALVPGNGPWVNKVDTIYFNLKGSETIEIEVQPFFWIADEKMELGDNMLTANFSLEKVVEDSKLQYVSLFVGNTRFVDNQFNVKETRVPLSEITNLESPILSMDLQDLDGDFIYARIGVKTVGNPQLIFSQVKKIEL